MWGDFDKRLNDRLFGGSGGSGGVTVTTLYYLGGYDNCLWKNPDDVGDESKKLTYEEAVSLTEDIIRLRCAYGGTIITFPCAEISHCQEEGYVYVAVPNGADFYIRK